MTIISYEEAIKKNISFAGKKKKLDFIFSTITDIQITNNIRLVKEMRQVLNNELQITNYTNKEIQHIAITFITLPDWNGVKYIEQKYYKNQKLYIDLIYNNYQRFCDATKQEAMKIMAEQTLRGTEKFLSKVKDFDYPKFYADLKELFEKEGIL